MKHKWLWLALFVVVDVIGIGAILVENIPAPNTVIQTAQVQYEQTTAQTAKEIIEPDKQDGVAATNRKCSERELFLIIPVTLIALFFIVITLREVWFRGECNKVESMPTSTEEERDAKKRRMAELGYYDW